MVPHNKEPPTLTGAEQRAESSGFDKSSSNVTSRSQSSDRCEKNKTNVDIKTLMGQFKQISKLFSGSVWYYLAQASATSAAAAFSLCLCEWRLGACNWPDSCKRSSNQEQSSPSKPFRQSVGSLLRLSGWQSRKQASSTSAVTPQSAGSLRVWDCKSGKTKSSPTREVKGACSGCWSRPCLLSRAKVSSSAPPVPSRSCCSSRANCLCAPHKPRRALSRYSNKRAYALLWLPQTARSRSASSIGFLVSNVRIWNKHRKIKKLN